MPLEGALTAMPFWLAAILGIVGFLHAVLKIKLIPQAPAWAGIVLLLVGGIPAMAHMGWLGASAAGTPTGDQVKQNGFTYTVNPSAQNHVSYDSNNKRFRTTVEWNTSTSSLVDSTVKMGFTVSRSDQNTEDSVYTASVDSNPEVTNQTEGEDYPIFDTTTDDKTKCSIEDGTGSVYESRSFKLEAGSSNTFNVTCHLNGQAVDKGLHPSFTTPYETPVVGISVAGQTYDYSYIYSKNVS